MKHRNLLKTMLLLSALVAGSGNVWGQVTLWSENFGSYSKDAVPNGGTYSYSCTDGASTTKIYEENTAGGTSPELLVSKKGSGTGAVGGTFTAVVPLTNIEGTLTLTYYQNKQKLSVSSPTAGVSGGQDLKPSAVGQQTTTFTGITRNMTSITIVFEATSTSNVRLDNIVLTGYQVPAAPTFSVPEGDFDAVFDLKITGEAGTTLKYTTDGSDPSSSGTATAVATNSTTVAIPAATTRVRAIAIKSGLNSNETDVTYTYNDASKTDPTFTLDVTSLDLKVNETGEINLTTDSDGTISFSCTNPAVTIDAEDGYAIVSANAAGTYTINVAVTATPTYNSGVGTVTLNVTKKTATVTIDDALLTNTDVYLQDPLDLGALVATVTDGGTPIGGATVTWNSSVPTVATIAADGTVTLVAAGTTTIRATFAGNSDYAEAYAEYELNVTDSDPDIKVNLTNTFFNTSVHTSGTAASNLSYTGSKDDLNITYAVSSGSNYYLNTGQIRTYSGVTLSFQAPVGYLLTSITFTADGTYWNTATPTVGDMSGDKVWTGSASSVAFTWSSTTRIVSVTVSLAPGVEVSDARFTTYVTPEAVEFTSVTAYKVAAVGSTTLSLATITSAPANTPVIIEADEDVYEFTPTGDPAAVGTNKLKASDGNVEGDGSTIFALGKKNGDVGFYLVKSGVKVPVGKAYIDTTVAGVKEFLTFDFGDNDADGINSLTPALSEGEGAIYNLAGQRISKMQKGINIVNGKKILF